MDAAQKKLVLETLRRPNSSSNKQAAEGSLREQVQAKVRVALEKGLGPEEDRFARKFLANHGAAAD